LLNLRSMRARFSFFKAFTIILLVVAALGLPSCQQDELCEDLTENPLRAGFYRSTDDGSQLLAVDSITVYGLNRPNDSIYNNQLNVLRMELPLDPARDSSAFVLHFPEATDTIWLTYERTTILVSVECGFAMHFQIQEAHYTTNFIETLEISDSQVINTADEHLKIFIPFDPPMPDPEP
jgi:hypothetical protein